MSVSFNRNIMRRDDYVFSLGFKLLFRVNRTIDVGLSPDLRDRHHQDQVYRRVAVTKKNRVLFCPQTVDATRTYRKEDHIL
jgi:hypothetical protein